MSIWTYINHYADQTFRNPYYLEPPQGQYPRIPKIPLTNYSDLSVWKDLFLRYSPENPRYNPKQTLNGPVQLSEDYRDTIMREQVDLNRTLTDILERSLQLQRKLEASKKKAEATGKSTSSFEVIKP